MGISSNSAKAAFSFPRVSPREIREGNEPEALKRVVEEAKKDRARDRGGDH